MTQDAPENDRRVPSNNELVSLSQLATPAPFDASGATPPRSGGQPHTVAQNVGATRTVAPTPNSTGSDARTVAVAAPGAPLTQVAPPTPAIGESAPATGNEHESVANVTVPAVIATAQALGAGATSFAAAPTTVPAAPSLPATSAAPAAAPPAIVNAPESETTLAVTLSEDMQTELGTAGVWAYAVYFTSAGAPVWTTLVDNGAVENGGTDNIGLPFPYVAGKVYFLVQSLGSGETSGLTQTITSESGINWTSALNGDFQYDSFEVTLQNGIDDAGNLTSVNGFGIPMEVSVAYTNDTTVNAGYSISANALVGNIASIDTSKTYVYDFTAGPLQGDYRMVASPAVSLGTNSPVTNPPFAATDWAGYVGSLEGTQAESIEITGIFNGAPTAKTSINPQGVWHNAGYFAYKLEWDSTDQVFWLAPMQSSQIKGYIKLTPADLENSIYATLGSAEIYASTSDVAPAYTINTGANNQWGKVLSEFLTGFTGGFYGESGKSPNPQVTTTVDLDQNGNWDPIYAFNKNLVTTPPTGYQTYDPYSLWFYEYSNSYGSGYSDSLMSQYSVGGPLIPVSEPGSAQNVPIIDLTLLANTETSDGYTTPEIYNYISSDTGGYVAPSTGASQTSVTLSFSTGAAYQPGVVLSSTAVITIAFLVSDSGGSPVWSTVTLNGATTPGGLWQIWTISYQNGNYVATAGGGGVEGSLTLANFPTATNGVSWYQIGIGDKTFNLYTTTSGGEFENPALPGQAGALAIDGLARLAPQPNTTPTIPTFTINFASGATVAVDPTLLVQDTSDIETQWNTLTPGPNAPVAGTLSGQGDTTFTALPGQNSQVSNSITAATDDFAFAWTGENDAPGTTIWVANYTNKIDALDIARVTIDTSGGQLVATTTATADLDGEWQTSGVVLNPGTYAVTMAAYLPTDTSFSTPLTPTSSTLTLDVTPCFAGGTRILTARGEVPVESLMPGDLVRARHAGLVPVVWVGHRHVACARHVRPQDVWPVRVRVHAFGAGRPRRDLLLSPDHAVFAGGVLIPVRYLVNGRTIVQEAVDEITYHHVELPAHDIVRAEGLACETYLDTGNRAAFENGGVAVQMFPDFGLRRWDADSCAPLVVAGPKLAAVRRMLERRSIPTEAPARRRA